MPVPGNFKKSFILLGLSLALASTDLAARAQYIGPQQPPKMQADTKVTKAIEKLLGKKKDDANTQPDQQPVIEEPESSHQEEEVKPGKPKEMPIPGVVAIPQRGPILSQPPLTSAKVEEPQIDPKNPPVLNHPKLDDPANPLGLVDAQNRLKKYIALNEAHRYAEAKPGLAQLRQWLVDMTEAHIGLYKTLNQIPSARAQAELEKTLALEFAQLRDRAMVEMAKVYIADKDFTKAIKDLTDVVKSQPRSKLGLRSYEMLQEIGFTEKLQLAQ
jgi:hypothetical protein